MSPFIPTLMARGTARVREREERLREEPPREPRGDGLVLLIVAVGVIAAGVRLVLG